MAASEAAVNAVMEALVLHQSDGYISSQDQWVGCICGERLPCRIEDGYPADEDEEHRVRAAHVAVAAADAAVDADRASIQAETLREAADEHYALADARPVPTGRIAESLRQTADWLRSRADRIEGKP
jgi:hypothetical protein